MRPWCARRRRFPVLGVCRMCAGCRVVDLRTGREWSRSATAPRGHAVWVWLREA